MSTARLREALELVLLFLSGGWSLEKEAEFLRITGAIQVNPIALTAHIRKVLAEPDAETLSLGFQQAEALATIFRALDALPVELRMPTAEVAVAWAVRVKP